MALQQDTMYGYTQYTQGYWRIDRISLTSKTDATAYFELYSSAETAEGGIRYAVPSGTRVVLFSYDPQSSLSVQAQGYEAAKLDIRFQGARDV